MSTRAALLFGAALVLAGAGCAANSSEAPLRSPSKDYPPPPPTTADGQVIGADGVEPSDRLKSGARVGTEDALAPGWQADEKGLRYDPNAPTGGSDHDDKKSKKKP